jgi:hypothetical protein
MRSSTSLLLCFLLAAGCASEPKLPDSVIAASRAAAPEGRVRLDVAENGVVREVVAEVPLAQAPQAAKDTAERERPGGRVLRCERWWRGESSGYAIAKLVLALEQIVVVDDAGRLVRTESEIPAARAPQIILDSGNTAAPGGSIRNVFEVRQGDRLEYSITKGIGDARIRVRVASGGEIRDVSREILATLAIASPVHTP